MRRTIITTVAALGVTLGAGAMAQTLDPATGARPGHEPGVGLSEPASGNASNIGPGDTRSTIAPRLPGSAALTDATTGQFLREAQTALTQHRTGAAQEALERAETRTLDRSTAQGMTDTPSANPLAQTIAQARQALGNRDIPGAQSLISQALLQTSMR